MSPMDSIRPKKETGFVFTKIDNDEFVNGFEKNREAKRQKI